MGRLQCVSGQHHQGQLFEKKLSPLSPTNLTTNTKACAASIQVSSGTKAEEINNISRHAIASIEFQVNRTDDPKVFLLSKGTQQSSRHIILRTAAYDDVRKQTVNPIQ